MLPDSPLRCRTCTLITNRFGIKGELVTEYWDTHPWPQEPRQSRRPLPSNTRVAVVALLIFVFGELFFEAEGAGNSASLLSLLLAGGYVWWRVQQQREISAQHEAEAAEWQRQQEAQAAEWQRHQEAQAAAREEEYQLWQRRAARLEDICALSPTEFEHAVAELLRRSGWTEVQVVGGPGDMGADITAHDLDGLRVIVQAKKYAEHLPVGAPTVRLLLGDVTVHRADRGVLVTTSTFTESAQALANREGIELIDRWRLADMARALDSPEGTEWTTPSKQDSRREEGVP